MGYDIYSMGVCFFEIGLWRLFLVLKDGRLKLSVLGKVVGINIEEENYEGSCC